MIFRLLLMACVTLAACGVSFSVSAANAGSPENVPAPLSGVGMLDTLDSCQDPGPNPYTAGTAVPQDRLTIGAPPGLVLTPMAIASAERLPFPPGHLTLARLEYRANTGTTTRKASGPLLFVVEAGAIEIFRTGERTRLGPGAFALVQLDQRFAFVNDSSEPATLLRLALTPVDGTDEPVADFISITPTPGPALMPPDRTWLFRSELPEFPPEPVDLFIACSLWTSSLGNDSMHRFAGPVGLKMLEGALSIDEDTTLAASGCALFEPQDAYRLRPGDDPPGGLLFGVFPKEQGLWLPATEGTADAHELGFGVSCGDAS